MMRLLLAVIVCFLSVDLYAACSAFQSQVTINEIYRQSGNNKPAFFEIKLLSSFSGSAADYNNWTIKICHDNNDCKVIDVDELTVSNSWLHTADGTDEFDIADYLNFKDGFDLAILDDNDNFIDYIQIHDYENGQYITERVEATEGLVISEDAGFVIQANREVVTNAVQLRNLWENDLYDPENLLELIENHDIGLIIRRADLFPVPILLAIDEYYELDESVAMNGFNYELLIPKTVSETSE